MHDGKKNYMAKMFIVKSEHKITFSMYLNL